LPGKGWGIKKSPSGASLSGNASLRRGEKKNIKLVSKAGFVWRGRNADKAKIEGDNFKKTDGQQKSSWSMKEPAPGNTPEGRKGGG